MATLLQLTCFILFIGMIHGRTFPSESQSRSVPDHFHDGMEKNSSMLSIFDDMNRIMAAMHRRFQHLFSFSSLPTNAGMDDRKQLDAVQPVCTTTTDLPSPPTQTLLEKKFRNTQTTTCIKELIIDGKKQLYKEMNVTDEQGVLISQSKIYQTITINTNNYTVPIETNVDKSVIAY